jgi:hypothetical protein
MRSKKPLILVLIAAAGALGSSLAQARDHADVQWSVTIGSNAHVPVYGHAPVVRPAPWPVVVHPVPMPVRYREPSRWDRDGDGIPNRHDRFYNPRWDVDGDGIPNHRDRRYNPPRYDGGYDGGYYGGHDRDRDRDGIPNHRDPHPGYPDRWGRY